MSGLRILIDARTWHSRFQTGVERYVLLLLEALIAAGDNCRIESVNLAALENVKPHFPKLPISAFPIRVHGVPSRHTFALQRLIDRILPDVLHSPFELPGRIHGCPIVYTLHDAGRYLYPHLMVKRVREVESPKLIQALREHRIDALVTVSEASRVDIEKLLPLGGLKCSVIPNFIAQSFWNALADPTKRLILETHYGIQGDYLLSVGIFSPTKNIPALCAAFCEALRRRPDLIPQTLVLVGRRGWERSISASGQAKIVITGNVPERDLAGLYSNARALVFPSRYEGFGLPLLEGLAAGCPIFCSDLPVFSEIGAKAIQTIDSSSASALTESLIEGIDFIPEPLEVRRTLKRFSSQVAGVKLLQLYETISLKRKWSEPKSGT